MGDIPDFKACSTPSLLPAFGAPILLLRLLRPADAAGARESLPPTLGFAYFAPAAASAATGAGLPALIAVAVVYDAGCAAGPVAVAAATAATCGTATARLPAEQAEHGTLTTVEVAVAPAGAVIVSAETCADSIAAWAAFSQAGAPDALAKLAREDAAAVGHPMASLPPEHAEHDTVIVVRGILAKEVTVEH